MPGETMVETAAALASYHESASAIERTNRQLRRFVIAALLVAVAIVLAVGLFCAFKVNQIRDTQVKTSQVQQCQTKALNGLLRDVPLAFSGDKIAADYSKIVKKC